MAHPDLDQLLNTLIPFAQQMLSKHGEFFPFGAVMSAEGKVEARAAYTGEEQPPSEEVIDLLTKGFCEQAAAGKIRAAAICYDVRIVPPGQTKKADAVCVSAEHQEGEAANVYLPYKKGWFGRISYDQLFGVARERKFFR